MTRLPCYRRALQRAQRRRRQWDKRQLAILPDGRRDLLSHMREAMRLEGIEHRLWLRLNCSSIQDTHPLQTRHHVS